MMLIEETQVAEAVLPVEALKRHLRFGTGFAEDYVQDPVLGSFLRAALAVIEARTGKALIRRGFIWTLSDWRDPEYAVFPVAPVSEMTSMTLVDRYGNGTPEDIGDYRIEADNFAPKLRPSSGHMPTVPSDGQVEIRFNAGYGAAFSEMPADLQQAVLLLAAHYYEYRDETALSQGCMPFGVSALIARYCPVRMGFGA